MITLHPLVLSNNPNRLWAQDGNKIVKLFIYLRLSRYVHVSKVYCNLLLNKNKIASESARVELLIKNNYETWKMQIEALLSKHDLWEYVSADEKIPNAATGSGAASANAAIIKLESVFASKGPIK